jgi:hypothetical protein
MVREKSVAQLDWEGRLVKQIAEADLGKGTASAVPTQT